MLINKSFRLINEKTAFVQKKDVGMTHKDKSVEYIATQ